MMPEAHYANKNQKRRTCSLFDRNKTSEFSATFFAGRPRRFPFVDRELLTPSEN
jgi:hypothetical protein